MPDRENSRLGIERVKDGLDHQEVDAAIDQCARRFFISFGKRVERDVAITRIIHVRRYRGRAIGRSEYAGNVARTARFHRLGIGAFAGKSRGGEIQFRNERFHAVVAHRRRVRIESIGFDDVGAGIEKLLMYFANDPWPRDREQVVVALQVAVPVRESLAAVIVFAEPVALDHRAHGAIEQHDAPLEQFKK